MTMEPTTPALKIALIYDENHSSKSEIAISDKLRSFKPSENIFVFTENRGNDTAVLKQYSVELLSSNESFCTATPCNLLIAHCLIGSGLSGYLKTIIKSIYFDSFLKKLFVEGHYLKYRPANYGIAQNSQFSFADMTPQMMMAIENVKGLYTHLDAYISKEPLEEQDEFIEGHMHVCTKALLSTPQFNSAIFGLISEALAVIKIDQVTKKLGAQFDADKELSLPLINELFNEGGPISTEILDKLSDLYRTQFHLRKVIKVIDRVFNKDSFPQNGVFAIRVGSRHQELLTQSLLEHYANAQIVEMKLDDTDLENAAEQIRAAFNGLK